jgi:hypothetical protein
MGSMVSQAHQVGELFARNASVHRIDVALRNRLVSYTERGTNDRLSDPLTIWAQYLFWRVMIGVGVVNDGSTS